MRVEDATVKKWEKQIAKALIGRRISEIRYLTPHEADLFGWHKRPLLIKLTNGTELIPMMDDEGNDGGALATNVKGIETIPVM